MLSSVGARPNKLLSLEPPRRATRRMNKLCSRNTGLATAAGRSAHGSRPRGFLSLRRPRSFCPVPLSLFDPLSFIRSISLFPFSLSHISHIPRTNYLCFLSLSLAVDTPCHRHTSFFFSLPLSLSLQPGSFHSAPHCYAPPAMSFRSPARFFLASVNDSGVPRRPHSWRGLYCARSRNTPGRSRALTAGARAEFPARPISAPLSLGCRRPNKYQINETAARNLDVLITDV